MKKTIFLIPIFLIFVAIPNTQSSSEGILIFAGSASKPPTEEVVRVFREKTGIPVDVIFGGSGFVLSQMKLAKKGDLYFPGSSDFMEKAKKEALVFLNRKNWLSISFLRLMFRKAILRGFILSKI